MRLRKNESPQAPVPMTSAGHGAKATEPEGLGRE